jgi:hypothetical protein
MIDKTIKANIDGQHQGTVFVDQWTINDENDSVYLSVSVPNGHLSVKMTKEQARELAEALMQIVEAE